MTEENECNPEESNYKLGRNIGVNVGCRLYKVQHATQFNVQFI